MARWWWSEERRRNELVDDLMDAAKGSFVVMYQALTAVSKRYKRHAPLSKTEVLEEIARRVRPPYVKE